MRGEGNRDAREGSRDTRDDRNREARGDDRGRDARGGERPARPSQPRLEPVTRGSDPNLLDDDEPSVPAEAWGTDDGSPASAVTLAADLPGEPPASDPDPLTFPLVDGSGAQLGEDVASVVGARFVPAGRISWFDAGDGDFVPGERVIVDSDRGARLAWIATAPARKATRDRGMRRVIRRATDQDLGRERDGDTGTQKALRTAKDKAAALRLPLKVFRVELGGGKLLVYYTSDDRMDLRDFVRDVAQATGLRIELRQLGVRDEAKAVGGIGSCGLTLCCTTWLPDFVPVSIKMAKDQGLVLSPTKVSGQCGRLKCCLVYEQAAYAELRKGLPKLGKRVIGGRGEGRVVEVDVLRQRVRVSYGPGDTEVVPATDVKPMFPSGGPPGAQPAGERGARRDDRGGRRDDRGGGGRGERRDPRERPPSGDHDVPYDPSKPVMSHDAFAAKLAALGDPGVVADEPDDDDIDARDTELTAGEKAALQAPSDELPAPDDDGFGDLPDEDPSRNPDRGDD